MGRCGWLGAMAQEFGSWGPGRVQREHRDAENSQMARDEAQAGGSALRPAGAPSLIRLG